MSTPESQQPSREVDFIKMTQKAYKEGERRRIRNDSKTNRFIELLDSPSASAKVIILLTSMWLAAAATLSIESDDNTDASNQSSPSSLFIG
mgnify:CR=1 FL=1